MEIRKKAIMYALHPGWIVSMNDGDDHYISVPQLAKLYSLAPNEYIVWDTENDRTLDPEEYVHLFPSYQGRYGRPDE